MPLPINSKSARDKLLPRREPYFWRLQTGLSIGYRKLTRGDGTWIARRTEHGKKQTHSLGTMASYDEAVSAVLAWANAMDAGVSSYGMTVKGACEHYLNHLGLQNGAKSKADAEGRFKRLVFDAKIGRVDIAKLRTS